MQNQLDEITDSRQALIELLMREQQEADGIPSVASQSAAQIAQNDVQERAQAQSIPCSFAQKRVWFIEQLTNQTTYNYDMNVFALNGALDIAALEDAINDIIERHQVLQVRFENDGGEPRQVLAEPYQITLTPQQLAQPETQEAQDAQVAAWLAQEAQRPFDLSQGQLFRASLFAISPQQHLLALNMHHIITDAWSLGVLIKEISALYNAYSSGTATATPVLAPLPIQYGDYARWQHEWLQGDVLQQQLGYWQQELAGSSGELRLPTDRPRPAVQSSRGAIWRFVLPRALSLQLQALARSHQATTFMAVMAAFQALLHRYSGQDDISVGTPSANREREELEGLIGFFVNTLVLRSQFSAEQSFADLLEQVRDKALGAYQHQDLPFEKVVEVLAPERSLSRSPLFQTMLAYQNVGRESFQLGQMEVKPYPLEVDIAKFDITFVAAEKEDGLHCAWLYALDLFDESSIAQMAQSFVQLVQAVVAQPRCAIASIDLLSANEHQQLRHACQALDGLDLGSISARFEAQAAAQPQAIALRYQQQQISYGQLNDEANQIAHYLQQQGVQAESLIGICLPRTPQMLAALLGILKVGAAYLPLDPHYPSARLAHILQDTQTALVLTDSTLSANLPPSAAQLLCLDQLQATLAQMPSTNLALAVSAQHLAYCMYTSGSTGLPKGVLINHGAVTSLVCETNYVELGRATCSLHAAPLNFDASTFEIWSALLNGGQLALFSGKVSAAHIVQQVQEYGVNTLWLTAALFKEVCDGPLLALRGVRQLLAGGDVLAPQAIARVLRELPETRLINGYGPTETTTFASSYRYSEATALHRHYIGQPIAHVQVLLLDPQLQAVPVGVPGEIYICGAGVARGYLHQPALTAEKFVRNPYAQAEQRMYRSGDLGRLDRDGNIEFLGRLDGMVKIRGYRIETGEVESALQGCAGVSDAAVVARDDGNGQQKLVGYVVSATGQQAPSVSQLRAQLLEILPDYMLPTNFVFLAKLPVNANGKVERKSLPEPEESRPELDQQFTRAQSTTQKMLVAIWCDLLKLDQVGIHDNFFDLGGHSLQATQVVARAEKACGKRVGLEIIFSHPTVYEIARHIDGGEGDVNHEENDASEHHLATPTSAAPITTMLRRAEKSAPLSYAQHRLWFLHQLAPELDHYNIPILLRLRGWLSTNLMQQVLQQIVERHQALRTRFDEVDGEPVQIVCDVEDFDLPVFDLSDASAAERPAQMEHIITTELAKPFDLRAGGLLRAFVIRVDDDESILALHMHHIVSDGWSIAVLYKEIGALYEALLNGEEARLPALSIQYTDFALWQREWLTGEVLAKQSAYWREQLLGGDEEIALPFDHPRPSVPSYRGANLQQTLSPQLYSQLQAFSKSHGSTLFMTMMAAFQTLLYRYSGQSDVSVGTAIANRNRAELENLIGFFVNTLVIRSQLAGEQSFLTLLEQVRQKAIGAYAHQDLPFEKVVEEVAPQRTMARNPLFHVMFLLQNAGGEQLQLAGLELAPLEREYKIEKFDLTMVVAESRGAQAQMTVQINYNTDLFEAATISRMLSHYLTLLEGALAAPSQALDLLPMLSQAERKQVLYEWNATSCTMPEQETLASLFAQQVARTPNAIALICGEQQLSYAELDIRANQLAHHLLASGVQAGQLVGVCLERSVEMVVSLYGILKAGAAYLPLDPDYPLQRLQYMLDDAQPVLVITDHSSAAKIQTHASFCIQARASELAQLPCTAPAIALDAEALAYVIYTSGSTGQPKGAMIAHRSIVNRLMWMQQEYQLGAQDRILQKTPFSFDVSVWEFFWPLLVGAQLVMAKPGGHRDPFYLQQVIQEVGITTLHFVPSMLRIFLGSANLADGAPHLRRVFCSGEALAESLQQLFFSSLPQVQLHNLYGPTEAAVDVTYWQCVANGNKYVPIGRPVANTQIYILNPALQPVPVGICGEIYIGGVQVGMGYLGRPELTAERFIADPFQAVGTRPTRLYRTGDIGRHLADGSIEYIGRLDQQVKVRGFRIELAEIEWALLRCTGIKDAAVLAPVDADGERALVAYLVSSDGQPLAVADYRSQLAQLLPEYMIPGKVYWLDALPLNANGKVDRKALPNDASNHAAAAAAHYVAPTTASEKLLAAIWCEVLKVERVGSQDNFFALGGHSLLATQVVARLKKEHGIQASLQTVFTTPNLADLAKQIAQLTTGQSQNLPLQRQQNVATIPLSSSQMRLWFFSKLQPKSCLYNLPLAFELQGRIEVASLHAALHEIVQRHQLLRTTFAIQQAWPVQLVGQVPEQVLQVIDLQEQTREQALAMLDEEVLTPFDLAHGPLLRCKLLQLSATHAIVVLNMHHIVSDGWSISILFDELQSAYHAHLHGLPCSLPALALQYSDFALWQRDWLASSAKEAQLAYWRDELAGSDGEINLPLSRPRPPVQSYRGGEKSLVLGAELTRQLQELSRQHEATLFMSLMAAFQVVLHHYSGQQDISVGTVIANRNQFELEKLIGFFANTVVIRGQFSPQQSFSTLLQQIKQKSLGAYAHQDLPFEKVVEELAPKRSLARNPLFHVMFLLQHGTGESVQFDGAQVKFLPTKIAFAKVDLTISLRLQGEQLQGFLEFNTDLFDAAVMDELWATYLHVLSRITAPASAEQPIAQLCQ